MKTPIRDRLISMKQSIADDFKFSKLDLGWIKTIFAYLFNSVAAYRVTPTTFTLPESCTIALTGDWGTGTDTAIRVLNQIKLYKPDYFIHLGDIYYSGTKSEIKRRFLNPLNEILPNVKILTLMGNHDAYSGGHGYYDLVDKIGQKSCHFVIGNNFIQLIGLNTGWSDRFNSQPIQLHPEEAVWANELIKNKKSILLTHHQPFSGFEDVNNITSNQLDSVAAWFTGHEHRLVVYEPHLGIQRLRTVGGSAVPEFVRDNYFDSKVPCKSIKVGSNGIVYKRSFAIMEINKEQVSIDYLDENNNFLYKEGF